VRMRHRVWLSMFLLAASSFSIFAWTDKSYLAFIWAVTVGIIMVVVFRCPSCGVPAGISKNGVGSPFIGEHCPHCGKEF